MHLNWIALFFAFALLPMPIGLVRAKFETTGDPWDAAGQLIGGFVILPVLACLDVAAWLSTFYLI